jgi:hypothetical protein
MRPTTPTRAGRLADASVDHTDALYMPINDSAVENVLRPVAVGRTNDFIWGATAGAGRLRC